jgi:FixJ family two-component response regulator
VVDDDAAFRTALARLLQAASYQVALYESASKLLETPWRNGPGCILLDLQMPGLDGLELQHRLAELGQSLPIVFLTGHGDVATSVPKDRLLEAVERALVRYEKGREQNAVLRSLRALVATLTPRELEVFKLVVRGKLNKQVAYELGTSERTIKAHRRSIMEKLRVRSLAEAVSIAERLGILTATVRSADSVRR